MTLEDDILIERYIKGKLDTAELEAFNARLEADVAFKEVVLLEKELSDALNENSWSSIETGKSSEVETYQKILQGDDIHDLRTVITQARNKYNNPQKTFKKWMLYASAAILAILLSLLIFKQPENTATNRLYTKYLEVSSLPALVTRTHSEDPTLYKAQQLFEAANYKEALILFKKTNIDNATLLLYRGIAEMQLDKFDKAEVTFNILIESDYLDAEKGYWYKALLYLKKQDVNAAKTQLKTIVTQRYYNWEKAKTLLNDIE